MSSQLKQALLAVLCFTMIGNAGCTTTQTVHGSQEALVQKKVRVGDKVTLHYVSGASVKVKLTSIGQESLTGISDDGRTVTTVYADLLSLEKKKVEVVKTAGAAVGIVALGAVMTGAIAAGTMVAVAGGI